MLLATYTPEMCIRPVTHSRQIPFHTQTVHTNISQADTRSLVHNKHAAIVLNFWMLSLGTLQSLAHLQDVLTSAQPSIYGKRNFIDTGQAQKLSETGKHKSNLTLVRPYCRIYINNRKPIKP